MVATWHHRIISAGLTLVAVAALAGCSDSSASPTAPAGSDQTPTTGGGTATPQEIALQPPAGAAFAGAHGKAKHKVDGQPELEIEIEDMQPGTQIVFLLDGQSLGSATVSSLGAAALELRGSAAPASVAGKQVQVQTAAGVLMVQGQFQ